VKIVIDFNDNPIGSILVIILVLYVAKEVIGK